jgi:hypothetical protein
VWGCLYTLYTIVMLPVALALAVAGGYLCFVEHSFLALPPTGLAYLIAHVGVKLGRYGAQQSVGTQGLATREDVEDLRRQYREDTGEDVSYERAEAALSRTARS